jgi:hypothetical protein
VIVMRQYLLAIHHATLLAELQDEHGAWRDAQ